MVISAQNKSWKQLLWYWLGIDIPVGNGWFIQFLLCDKPPLPFRSIDIYRLWSQIVQLDLIFMCRKFSPSFNIVKSWKTHGTESWNRIATNIVYNVWPIFKKPNTKFEINPVCGRLDYCTENFLYYLICWKKGKSHEIESW